MNHYKLISKSEIQEMIENMGKEFTNTKEALEGISPISKVSKCLGVFEKAKNDLENIDGYTLRFFKSCKADDNPDWSQERICLGMCKPLVSKQVLVSFGQSEDEMIATTLHECKHASDYEDNPNTYCSNREAECEEYAAEKCKEWYDIDYKPHTTKSNGGRVLVPSLYGGHQKANRYGNYIQWTCDVTGYLREAVITDGGFVPVKSYWNNVYGWQCQIIPPR